MRGSERVRRGAGVNGPTSPHYRVPGGVLGEFVEILWLYEGYVRPHARERLLPMATTELVIDLRGGAIASRATTVAGPHSEHWVLDTSEELAVLGVHFRAGGGFPFFNVPAGELHNVRAGLDALWGAAAALLIEQVLAAPTPDGKFDVLERTLLARARTLERHRAVAFAVRELSKPPPAPGIAEVTGAVSMSQRRFLDRFRSEVGMAPKLFARVQRFQSVVGTVHVASEVDWSDVAAACGYFDQAHFIHDFRAFSGFTPAAYLALKSEHRNHVPLPG
ncbi:MAG: AraC family transcriptional regulator [Steroidobacteraceae bacterium]